MDSSRMWSNRFEPQRHREQKACVENARMNALQPNRVAGYPSMLHQLCLAADRGELHIAPIVITSSAEPLFPETHAALERTFDQQRV